MFLFGGEFVIVTMLFFAIVSLVLQKKYNKKILRNFTISLSVVTSLLIFNWVITGFSFAYVEYPKYILRVLAVNLSMLALYNVKEVTYKDLEWLLKLVVIHATLNFVFGFLLSPLFIFVSSSEGFQTSTLGYVFFYMANVNVAGIDIYRNQSFFWEPGVLGFILNIYLFILLFRENIQKLKGYLIPLICFLILTTFSTTGLGLMVIQFVFYFFKGKISVKKVALSLVSILLIMPIFIHNLQEKKTGSGEKSYVMRYYDSLIALDITYNNPLFGVGLSSLRYNLEQTKYPRFSESDLEEGKPSTNSILSTFASFGIPITLLILFGLYRQQIIPFNRKMIFGMFLILLASEPLILSSFFILFICSSFYVTEEDRTIFP